MRYAIYFAPPPASPLARFGRQWLGRDAETGEAVATPAHAGVAPERLAAWTASPRRYGFHATLKPPFRLADGAANPYLLQAGLLASGLEGIRQKRNPGPRLDIDMYAEGHLAKDAKRLPLNLLDALRRLDASAVIKGAFGEATVAAYLKLKNADWSDYARHLTEWERQTTLDC